MPRRKSGAWLIRQKRDSFVKKSKQDSYRSRAVYKLQEIDVHHRLLRKGQVVVDLGAAPGGWSQYTAQRVGPSGMVTAVDLSTINPITGVRCVTADICDPNTIAVIKQTNQNKMCDVVLSDACPDITGVRIVDQAAFVNLFDAILECAVPLLLKNGVFLAKVIGGDEIDNITQKIKKYFDSIRWIKPAASRDSSREFYVLAKQIKTGYHNKS